MLFVTIVIITTWWSTCVVAKQQTTTQIIAPTMPSPLSPVYQDGRFEVGCLREGIHQFYYEIVIRRPPHTPGETNLHTNTMLLQKKILKGAPNGNQKDWQTENCTVTTELSQWRFKCSILEVYGRSFILRLTNITSNNGTLLTYTTEKAIEQDDIWHCLYKPHVKWTLYENGFTMNVRIGHFLEPRTNKIFIRTDNHKVLLYKLGNMKNNYLSDRIYGLQKCKTYNVTIEVHVVIGFLLESKPFYYREKVKTACEEISQNISQKKPNDDRSTEIILASVGALFLVMVVVLLFRYTKKKIEIMKNNVLGPRGPVELIVPITESEENEDDSITYARNDHSHDYDSIAKQQKHCNGGTSPRSPQFTRQDFEYIQQENIYDSCKLSNGFT